MVNGSQGNRGPLLTEHMREVDLKDEPAVSLVRLRSEDGEYGRTFSRLGEHAVNGQWLR